MRRLPPCDEAIAPNRNCPLTQPILSRVHTLENHFFNREWKKCKPSRCVLNATAVQKSNSTSEWCELITHCLLVPSVFSDGARATAIVTLRSFRDARHPCQAQTVVRLPPLRLGSPQP
jgi:hypothetical protein